MQKKYKNNCTIWYRFCVILVRKNVAKNINLHFFFIFLTFVFTFLGYVTPSTLSSFIFGRTKIFLFPLYDNHCAALCLFDRKCSQINCMLMKDTDCGRTFPPGIPPQRSTCAHAVSFNISRAVRMRTFNVVCWNLPALVESLVSKELVLGWKPSPSYY